MRTALYTLVFFDYRPDLERLARWLTPRAARDFPEATALRLRVHKTPTPPPDDLRRYGFPAGDERVVATVRLR
jgi:hypothetical protein